MNNFFLSRHLDIKSLECRAMNTVNITLYENVFGIIDN